MTPSALIIFGSLCAAFTAPEPRAVAVIPVHVNDVEAADTLRVSVEFSFRVQLIEPPASHGEAIRAYGGRQVMLSVPLYDDLMRCVGERGIRARVR